MPVSLRVHEHQKVPGASDETRVVRRRPYIRIATDGFTLFLQAEQVWPAEGPALSEDEYPEGFWEEVNKCSEAHLKDVGFVIPEDKRVSKIGTPTRTRKKGAA